MILNLFKKNIKLYFSFIYVNYIYFKNGQKSFSQAGEDSILSLFLDKKTGFYIDVGAHNPIILNNTYLFYKRGWKGINIEPNPVNVALFKRIRKRDININIGVGKELGEIPFYIFDSSMLSTFSHKSYSENKKMGHSVTEIKKILIKPLSKIIDEHLPNDQMIDFISIDTEGFDLQVLDSNDWEKYRPKFIILETLEYRKDGKGKKLNHIYDNYMSNIMYKKIADTYINTIYKDCKK